MDVLNKSFLKSFLQNVQENTFKSLLKVTSAPKLLFHEVDPDADLMIFFYLKEIYYFVLETFRFLCFCKIHIFQKLRRHHGHCYIMEVTLISFKF